ncbi:capsule assembly Wzi family protein [Steroidobacter sp.]|uniref:capsule assembly Wzi family protein n=1 Tax=Steroidobacter sp. TaxID=1978227 RepID=UPI001A48BB42|nr:capsule assembly Wzi family protein [Steroidobacter sp.]MBL8270712.1 hypothetical protein [Steroidobacter sp.]
MALLALLGMTVGMPAAARGVSPYLPMGMSPDMDRKIQRVLALGGKTVMRKPIPAAVVLEALPRACKSDEALCAEVRAYLQRYMKKSGVTHARVTAAVVDGDSSSAQPNAHGVDVNDAWEARVGGYYQWNDYVLISAGAIASDDEVIPTGSLLSLGTDYAQLDIGYRDHWLSPLNDSSSLISTEAPTMPSVTLSNYKPISRLGIGYEVFAAEMSKQENLPTLDGLGVTSGKPRLAGMQGSVSPAEGLGFALSRVTQYGGGSPDGGTLSDFRKALIGSNSPTQLSEFGNRVASLTSSIIFPGKTPFAVHMEYAGEDNAYAGNYRLGATNMSVGIDFPQLWQNFDVTYEVSEWQNAWYVHHVYRDGLVNREHVIGHWFGDQRVFGDAIGGQSHSLRAGWRSPSGRYWQATYRTMSLDEAWRVAGPEVGYDTFQSLRLDVSMDVRGFAVDAGVQVGQDVFGDSFARLQASVDFAQPGPRGGGRSSYSESSESDWSKTQVFVDVGANYGSVKKIFGVDIPVVRTDSEVTPHIAFGARRNVSRRSDFGVRLELDRLDDNNLISLRALDYRFRFNPKLAVNVFGGAARYDFGLPAYGYYYGAGVQYMDILPGWDLSLDARHHEKLGRDKTLPSDPPITPDRTRLFFDADGIAVYLSRRL